MLEPWLGLESIYRLLYYFCLRRLFIHDNINSDYEETSVDDIIILRYFFAIIQRKSSSSSPLGPYKTLVVGS